MNAWLPSVDVVTRCLAAGVREFVVCGGARNAALLEALARAEAAGAIRLWRHFEERGAAFFALGRTMATHEPCAVVTTSGTAAAELLPAVIEAFYQARPLVAITADRPALFRGKGAPQSIDQTMLFGPHAFQGALEEWNGKQPIHLNVELDEAFEAGEANFANATAGEFKPEKDRLDVASLARWLREDHFKGIVVLLGGLEPEDREEVYHFCRELDVPLVAEATSGLREELAGLAIHDADRVLKASPPGKILRLGEVPSGRFWRDLEGLTEVQVWSICRNGLPGLARPSNVTCGPLQRVLPAIGQIESAGDALDLLVKASARSARIDELLETWPDSEPALLRAISHYACLGGGIYLGNSLPIREWNDFAQWTRSSPPIRASRGVNGIDGQLATWLGWSADTADAWTIVGDLTALYDLAAPFVLGQVEQQGRVLAVINNSGGKIFDRLPRLASMNPRAAECLVNPHAANLAGLAALWGMQHLVIRGPDDLDHFEPGDETVLLEIVPDPDQTRGFWQDWQRLAP